VIAVIDYGGGNVGSLLSALHKHTDSVTLTSDPSVVETAAAAILPGDGAFGPTMDALRERKLLPAILALIEKGQPFLGICVGMQILFEGSDEFGGSRGVGFFPGNVTRFEGRARVPHIGWSRLRLLRNHNIVAGLQTPEYAYFMHSHRAPLTAATVASAANEGDFSAVVASGNVVGTQFHPEKSQKAGARMLRNFVESTRSNGGRPNGNQTLGHI